MYAILSVDAWTPTDGARLLIAMPKPTSNPHAIGRIVSVTPRVGGHMQTFDLTVEVESDDHAAAMAAYRHALALDCYADPAEAERWHAIDVEHYRRHRYARNHWNGWSPE